MLLSCLKPVRPMPSLLPLLVTQYPAYLYNPAMMQGMPMTLPAGESICGSTAYFRPVLSFTLPMHQARVRTASLREDEKTSTSSLRVRRKNRVSGAVFSSEKAVHRDVLTLSTLSLSRRSNVVCHVFQRPGDLLACGR